MIDDLKLIEKFLICITGGIAAFWYRPRYRVSDVEDVDSYGNKVYHKINLDSCCFPVRWGVKDPKNEGVHYIYTKKGIPLCLCNFCCIDKYEIHTATEKNKPKDLIGTAKCFFKFPNCGAEVFDKDNKKLGYWGTTHNPKECIVLCLKSCVCGICIHCCPSKHLLPYHKPDNNKAVARSVIEAPCCTKIFPCCLPPWMVVHQTQDSTQDKYIQLGGLIYGASNLCFPLLTQVKTADAEYTGHATQFGF